MLFFSNTKINIGLSILNKRQDGFHDIQSVFYPIPYGDAIEFVEIDGVGEIQIEVVGLKIPGDINNNLISKAFCLLTEKYNLPSIKCVLLKNVPTGSGIGGGSSDGAWMLKALNEFFELNLKIGQLEEFALELGSDCPFFIESKAKLVEGRGELLRKCDVDLKNAYAILLKPDLHISTAESYANLTIKSLPNINLTGVKEWKREDWKNCIFNDFEKYAFEKYPELSKIKDELYQNGSFYSSMSGTGSVVYGLFEKKPKRKFWKSDQLLWSGFLE